jgi:REP element-mobilizing transposase RayT
MIKHTQAFSLGKDFSPFQGLLVNSLKRHNTLMMGQSLLRVATHLVFGTKNRQPLIDEAIEPELYAYLGGVCNEMDCQSIKVGGYLDHVHVLCLLSKKVALMDLLEEVKKRSSKWIKTKGEQYENFYWQKGYSAFSVNYMEIDKVIYYIHNQHLHHNGESFQQEYIRMLIENMMEYDERYIWD